METTKPSSKKFIINYGVLLGILSVLLGVIIYITGNVGEQNWTATAVGFLIIVASIVLGLKAFKAANNGFLNLSDALKIGIGIALIGGVLSVIWTLILMNFIEPDMIEQIMEVQREQLTERMPDMSEEQLEQSLAMVKKFSSPLIISAFALIGNLFFGFIISLIAGLIMQKKEELY